MADQYALLSLRNRIAYRNNGGIHYESATHIIQSALGMGVSVAELTESLGGTRPDSLPTFAIESEAELDNVLWHNWQAWGGTDITPLLSKLGATLRFEEVKRAIPGVQADDCFFVSSAEPIPAVLIQGTWDGRTISRLMVYIDMSGTDVADDISWSNYGRAQLGQAQETMPRGEYKEWRLLYPKRSEDE